jgi:hypothetical protein
MKVVVNDLPASAGFGYRPAPIHDAGNKVFLPIYAEVYLGEVIISKYGLTPVYLVGNTVATNGLNTLLLDYIKLEPVL